MSTKKVVVKSKLKVVNVAMKNAEASDLENVEKFYQMLIEQKEEQIKDLKHNLSTSELENSRSISKLEKSLEDATKAEAEAVGTVDVESIKTNNDRANFILVYEARLNSKRQEVQNLTDTLEKLKTDFEKEKEETNLKITMLEQDIVEISELEK